MQKRIDHAIDGDGSIPKVMFIVFNVMRTEKFAEFILERDRFVVFVLVFNVR